MKELVVNKSANRTAAIVAVVLLLLGLVGFFVLQGRHGREMKDLRAEARLTATGLAMDVTRTLATTISDDAARLEHAMLDAQLAAIVRGRHVAAVMVVNRNGEVVATTDQRQAGRQMDDVASQAALAVNEVTAMETQPTPGQIEVAAPLFVGPERIGTVRVFVELGEFTPLPASK